MTRPLLFSAGGSDESRDLARAGAPVDLDRLVPPPPGRAPEESPWELEIGFGKGRYLLRRAKESPDRRFLGIEMAAEYFRILVERARRDGLGNVVAIRGEALYILSAVLPTRFADVVHVYHPDPWPKAKHHKRRLFDPVTVDLVLGALRPGGTLYFATDHLDYGDIVVEILERHPGVAVRRVEGPWADGPRTNYEAKYMEEGRPILRLVVTLEDGTVDLHPDGRTGIVSGIRPPDPDTDPDPDEEER